MGSSRDGGLALMLSAVIVLSVAYSDRASRAEAHRDRARGESGG